MNDSIQGIQPLWDSLSLAQRRESPSQPVTDVLFGDIYRSAIENVRQSDEEKSQAEYLLATGQLDNPSAQTIASTKAELSVQLLVQLRNKALEAYSELMRINM